MALVFLQPDLGTALVYGAALTAVLFLAGVRWLHLVAPRRRRAPCSITSVLWFLPAAGVEVLKPYQTARLTGFTNPDERPGRVTYNVTQSMTAVGAGGLSGRGVEGASQTRLDYLPEHATDFVFASFAEQRGFVGTSILLLLYLLVVWRGLRVVTVAGDLYGAVVAGGIVFAFLFQVFVNVGMTMGIAPVTGIPLPFVTVGGSSMVANLLAIGVLQSIHARGRDGRGALVPLGFGIGADHRPRPRDARARGQRGPDRDRRARCARARDRARRRRRPVRDRRRRRPARARSSRSGSIEGDPSEGELAASRRISRARDAGRRRPPGRRR